MMTITVRNQNNWLMVVRDEKATTWTVEKKLRWLPSVLDHYDDIIM